MPTIFLHVGQRCLIRSCSASSYLVAGRYEGRYSFPSKDTRGALDDLSFGVHGLELRKLEVQSGRRAECQYVIAVLCTKLGDLS